MQMHCLCSIQQSMHLLFSCILFLLESHGKADRHIMRPTSYFQFVAKRPTIRDSPFEPKMALMQLTHHNITTDLFSLKLPAVRDMLLIDFVVLADISPVVPWDLQSPSEIIYGQVLAEKRKFSLPALSVHISPFSLLHSEPLCGLFRQSCFLRPNLHQQRSNSAGSDDGNISLLVSLVWFGLLLLSTWQPLQPLETSLLQFSKVGDWLQLHICMFTVRLVWYIQIHYPDISCLSESSLRSFGRPLRKRFFMWANFS